MSHPEISAYDYEKQCWTAGPEAIALRRSQLNDVLSILQSAEGRKYMRFMGKNPSNLLDEIADVQSQIASLPA